LKNYNSRFLLYFLSYLLFSFSLFAQEIEIPSVALNNIGFNIKGSGFPDSLSSAEIVFNGEEHEQHFNLSLTEGTFDTTVIIDESADYEVYISGITGNTQSINVIPGFLSIIPPLIAILLALIFREVILSLILGIYSGAVFIYGFNPLTGLLRLIDKYIINSLSDVSHLQIVVFTLLFGGVIGLISRGGGTKGIADSLSRFAKTRKSGMIATWLSGLIIFFDDYANTLVVGNLMRPITDKLKISREKLSFIVDATSAPVASVVLISSWIGYEVGLIQDGLNMIGSSANAYSTFIATIPFRFYPLAMIFFVFLISYTKRDFGAMLKAERRFVNPGPGPVINSSADKNSDVDEIMGSNIKAKWYNGVVPILTIIIVTVIGLVYTGISSLNEHGINNYNLTDIIGNSDSYKALLWGSFAACVVAAVMFALQKILSLKEIIDSWFNGLRSMLLAIVILTLAWSIGTITNEIRTADYIISLISESIDPRFLPVIVFLVCGLTSFATGTSWGTMAIMMPIVIPLASVVTGIHNYSPGDTQLILVGVISSVLAGCVWGDHCSPISDTTILSSIASKCDHIDHVRTQLPYAVVVGIICMLCGDILTAYGLSPYISLIIIAGILTGIMYLWGSKVDTD